ncbi:MAG: CYTH domain-containing protein [Clostridiales Family XIII bacterium]|jgi:inorganic triphosphatase YgiF|nr:CYTH domain-containing protein [Clostridiales Family XIII bacterium]
MEIELKYKIETPEKIDKILNDPVLRKIAEDGTDETVTMKAAYFDTEDNILIKNNIAFRIRSEGSKIIATLKWKDTDEGISGLYVREEINVPVTDESCFLAPDPSIFKESKVGRDLLDVIAGKPLVNIFDINFRRDRFKVDSGDSIMEISVDEGSIVTTNGTLPIRELEIELFTGNREDLIKLGTSIASKHGLVPETVTKFGRGVALINQ